MDLDEVLVNHVGAVASQVDKLTEHEKYIPESVIGEWWCDKLERHFPSDAHHMCTVDTRLDEAIRSKSGQSAYGFCLDSQKAGWAQLHFLSRALKDGGRVQIWVRDSATLLSSRLTYPSHFSPFESYQDPSSCLTLRYLG